MRWFASVEDAAWVSNLVEIFQIFCISQNASLRPLCLGLRQSANHSACPDPPRLLPQERVPAPAQDRNPLKLFFELNLSAAMLQQLKQANFVYPTPVQEAAIPPAMAGRDVLATAQTGTGKTLSFLVPLIERLAVEPASTRALVMLPTRELAMQVIDAWRNLVQSDERAALVCGGLPEAPQLATIRRGARLIVATPGRLEDYLSRGLVKLDGVKMLVLDEVDRMLDMGFKPAIHRIAALLPKGRQTMCYSATLSPAIREVAGLYLNNPVHIEIAATLKPSANVKLQTFEVPVDKKQELLEHLLQSNKGSFMVFVRTKHGADRVARRLAKAGYAAAPIHGDRTQSQRNSALRGFTEGRHRVLVATDVVARGIDVPDVAHVVNFDLPREAEDFVHRVGRTGRASSQGVASTFAAPSETRTLKRMEKELSVKPARFKVHPMDSAIQHVA
jgi:ATP-dependent RNA helicase RhlE